MKKNFAYIILIFIIFFFNKTDSKIQNNIVLKVENKIITQFEIKNKILSTLILANQEVTQENINRLKNQALEFLIQFRLKEIELSKYNFSYDNSEIIDYVNSISSNDIQTIKKKFVENNLDYQLFLEEVKIQLKWQKFIYQIYSKKIEIDESIINEEVENYLKNKSDIEEFKISEIEILLNGKSENNVIADIKSKISIDGFKKTAFNYSVSSTAKQNGDLGWVNGKSLSDKIYNIITKMKVGDVTKPIKTQNSILFLKLDDKKISKKKDINLVKLKESIIIQKRNELFNLYSRSHLSKLKNTSIIEYK